MAVDPQEASAPVAAPAAPTAPAPVCPFESIPLELLLRITYWLPTSDLGSMRLTCRSIERMLYNSWADEFFSCKQFMLSPYSLQGLVDMAKSRLGSRITRLQLGTDHFRDPVHCVSPSFVALDDHQRAYDDYAAQCEMLMSGEHIDLLAEAFSHLGDTLEDVVIRNFNSRRRSRDGPGARWRSYGAARAERYARDCLTMQAPAEDGHTGDSYVGKLSATFNAVLTALGRCPNARPRGIEILSVNPASGAGCLPDSAFALGSSSRKEGVVSTLAQLRKLHLALNLRVPYRRSAADPAALDAVNKLPWFLHHTARLQNLRINGTHDKADVMDRVLGWLATPASTPPPSGAASRTSSFSSTTSGTNALQRVHSHSPPPFTPSPGSSWPPPPALANLTELSLGHMAVDHGVIVDLVRKTAPTLRRLDLVLLCAVATTDPDEVLPRGAIWNKVLSAITKTPGLDLHHVGLRLLRETCASPEDAGVFGDNPYHGVDILLKDGRPELDYTGSEWRQALLDTVADLRARGRTPSPEPEMSEDEELSEDDEEMQDDDDHL